MFYLENDVCGRVEVQNECVFPRKIVFYIPVLETLQSQLRNEAILSEV